MKFTVEEHQRRVREILKAKQAMKKPADPRAIMSKLLEKRG